MNGQAQYLGEGICRGVRGEVDGSEGSSLCEREAGIGRIQQIRYNAVRGLRNMGFGGSGRIRGYRSTGVIPDLQLLGQAEGGDSRHCDEPCDKMGQDPVESDKGHQGGQQAHGPS